MARACTHARSRASTALKRSGTENCCMHGAGGVPLKGKVQKKQKKPKPTHETAEDEAAAAGAADDSTKQGAQKPPAGSRLDVTHVLSCKQSACRPVPCAFP